MRRKGSSLCRLAGEEGRVSDDKGCDANSVHIITQKYLSDVGERRHYRCWLYIKCSFNIIQLGRAREKTCFMFVTVPVCSSSLHNHVVFGRGFGRFTV